MRQINCGTSAAVGRTGHGSLTALIADLAVVMAGRAGAAVLSRLGVLVSRTTTSRVLMAQATPTGAAPAVLNVDDFAPGRGCRYAMLLIDARTLT
jgi:hypothetical protein